MLTSDWTPHTVMGRRRLGDPRIGGVGPRQHVTQAQNSHELTLRYEPHGATGR